MISYISWKIIDLDLWKCSILTNLWVWYEINISDLTSVQIEIWKSVEFFIYHHITEAWQSLFGFLTKEEKQFFLEFIKVPWVWWRTSLNILDLWISQIYNSFLNEDKEFFSNAKWVWKKTSQKIYIEMKDKDFIKDINISSLAHNKFWINNNQKHIKETLVSLWYNLNKIDEILKNIPDDIKEIWEVVNYVIKNIK